MKITILEDDPLICKSIVQLLQTQGFEVVAFSDALSFFESDALKISYCLIVDLGLPDISGIDVIETVRKTSTELPIIVMSGTVDDVTADLIAQWGRTWKLQKPYRANKLFATVNECLR